MTDTRGGVDCWAPELGAKAGQLLGLGSRSLWGDGNVVIAADATAVDMLKERREEGEGWIYRPEDFLQAVTCSASGSLAERVAVLTAGPEADRYKPLQIVRWNLEPLPNESHNVETRADQQRVWRKAKVGFFYIDFFFFISDGGDCFVEGEE